MADEIPQIHAAHNIDTMRQSFSSIQIQINWVQSKTLSGNN